MRFFKLEYLYAPTDFQYPKVQAVPIYGRGMIEFKDRVLKVDDHALAEGLAYGYRPNLKIQTSVDGLNSERSQGPPFKILEISEGEYNEILGLAPEPAVVASAEPNSEDADNGVSDIGGDQDSYRDHWDE